MRRLTRKCPNNLSYRIPLDMGDENTECRITYAPHGGTCVFGDHVDLLGRYEDLGYEPNELAKIIEIAARYRLLPEQTKKES